MAYERERPRRRAIEERAARARRRQRSDLGPRILAAIPAIAFAIFIVTEGGLIFALGAGALGVMALRELYTLMEKGRPVIPAGMLILLGLVLAALYGDQYQVLLVLAAGVPATFFFAVTRRRRQNVTWSMAATMLGVAWIGMALAHAVLLRELPHGGALLVDVLIATFIGDTCAYFGGRAYGVRPLAPRISPNKTFEGFLFGIVGGTLAFWLFAVAYQDWFKGEDALVIGFCVALAAPFGDLFESLIKRDLGVKDTGRFFGAHGGVLDRLDAVFFAVVAGYYVSVAVL